MRFPFIIGGERGGKAQDITEYIYTPNGIKQFGDLVVGDQVFTHDGQPTTVTHVHPIMYNRPCYRVTFEDGQSLVVDGDHLWTVQDEKQRKNSCRRKVRGVETRVVPAELITERKHSILSTTEIAELGVQVPATRSRVAFNRFSVLAPLPVAHPEAELPIHPYVLGCWLGDGAAGSSQISKPDAEMFERIRSFGYEVHGPGPNGITHSVIGLVTSLKAAGLHKCKHVPEQYLRASVEQRWELLRGLMDTDGCCDERGQAYFDNTNKRIIDAVVELAFSLGLKPTLTENRAILNGKDYGQVWTVFLMARDPLFTIPRKAERQKLEPAGHSRHRYIRSIEPVESVPVRCITVADPSGLYMVGRSYIPTHNSIATKGIILPHAAMLPQIKASRFYNELGQLRFDPKDQSSKPRNPDIALFGPSYTEPRVEFQYLEDELRALGLIPHGWKHLSKPQDGPWRLTTAAGVVIATWSMDDPGTIRAMDLEMAAICEAGKCPYEGVERVRGRVSAQKGPVVYSGCLRGDTLVQTSEGLLSLEELKGTPVGYTVRGKKGRGQVVQWHDNGVQPTKIVSFNYGMEIEGTLNHKLLVRGPGLGGAQWRRLDELKLGDKVWASLDVDIWGQNHLDPDDAYLAGLYLGDGSMELNKRGGGRVTITVGMHETETRDFLTARGYYGQNSLHLRSTKDAVTVFAAGIPGEWKADDKEIPSFIRCADRETVRHFLAGLFDADGCAKIDGSVTLTSNSRRMLEQVQALMFNFGLVSGIVNKDHGEFVCNTLTIQAGADFQERVGFRLTRKAERCISGEKRQRLPSRQTDTGTRTGSQWGDCQFVTVKEIRNSECHTYDLSVPEGRSYTANGVISHNTLEESHQWYRDWAVMGLRENKFLIKTYSLPTWTNLHNFPGGRQDSEILLMEATYPDDVFAMRVAGEPRPPRHRVMKEVTEAHVKVIDVTQIPGVQFEICLDPGYASAYALLMVAKWKEDIEELNLTTGQMEKTWRWRFHFVDELYEQGRISNEMIDLLKAHPLWPELDKQHYGVFDIAAKGHRDANESALDIWKKRLPKWNWNMRYWHEDRLIERLRTSAKSNQFTISPNCKGLLAECGLEEPVFPEMHPWKYMTTRDGVVSGEKPIDKWNHSCKAAGYYLLDQLGQVERITKASNFNRLTQNKPKRNLASTGKR